MIFDSFDNNSVSSTSPIRENNPFYFSSFLNEHGVDLVMEVILQGIMVRILGFGENLKSEVGRETERG